MPANHHPENPLVRRDAQRWVAFFALALGLPAPARAAEPTAEQVVERLLDNDAWGSSGALVKAHMVIKSTSGAAREMAFQSKSRKSSPRLTKSLLRFTAPADLAGQAFLQIEKADGDDDRFLWIPELKKAKRIAGASRKSAFSGTDFSYADMDRRDLREGAAKLLAAEKVGKHDCHHLEVTPKGDSPYARLEVWARVSDFVPLKTVGYGSNGQPIKTIETRETKKIDRKLFITRSLVTNHAEGRTTELVLDEIKPTDAIADDEFTTRALEKE
jgi:outer membrane lipoprotein-sorting protein